MDNVYTVQQLFENRVFRVPDYQRGYAWEEQHWEDFLDDLELLPDSKEHYTGTLVLDPSRDGISITDTEGGAHHVFDVVDGQQRLTTIVIVLDALRRELQAFESQKALAEGIGKRYIEAVELESRQPFQKLRLNEDCRAFFTDVILANHPTPHGASIYSHQRLLGAKTHFENFFRQKKEENKEQYLQWLIRFHRKVTQQLRINLYTVSDASEVGVIFEVMNNRGKPLSELEKVKNYLLYLTSKLDIQQHDLAERINKTWTNVFQRMMSADLVNYPEENQLLRAHWLACYDPTPKNWKGSKSVKERFGLKLYRAKHKQLLADLIEYTKSLDSASLAYCDVQQSRASNAFAAWSRSARLRGEIVKWATKLRRIRVLAPFMPLLIAARLRFPSEPSKYLNLLRHCEIYAFRVYRFAEKRANAGQTRLFRLANDLFNNQERFDSVLKEMNALTLAYCPNRSFEHDLKDEDEANWYNWSGIKYFLFEYEEHLAKKEDVRIAWEDIEASAKEKSIEHIFPQTPTHEYWTARFTEFGRELCLHALGNLVLASRDANSSYGNKPFPEKRGEAGSSSPCYANAMLFQERELAQCDDWTPMRILARRRKLAGWALERWKVEEGATGYVEPSEDEEINGTDQDDDE
jgi:hypothetical protein